MVMSAQLLQTVANQSITLTAIVVSSTVSIVSSTLRSGVTIIAESQHIFAWRDFRDLYHIKNGWSISEGIVVVGREHLSSLGRVGTPTAI